MFGFVSKKRLMKEMIDIYEKNLANPKSKEYAKWHIFELGNANALNALAYRLGFQGKFTDECVKVDNCAFKN